jgi:hypothetical protein
MAGAGAGSGSPGNSGLLVGKGARWVSLETILLLALS